MRPAPRVGGGQMLGLGTQAEDLRYESVSSPPLSRQMSSLCWKDLG